MPLCKRLEGKSNSYGHDAHWTMVLHTAVAIAACETRRRRSVKLGRRKMKVKIAVLSSEVFMVEILKYEQKFQNIEMIPFIYSHPKDCQAIISEINNCDVLLFAGSTPYFFAKEQVKQKNIPAVYIPFDEYTLTLTLFGILIKHQEDWQRMSIDISKSIYVDRVMKEMGIKNEGWYVKDYIGIVGKNNTHFDTNEILQFHQNLWEKGKTSFAITSIDFIYEQLCRMKIPCAMMRVPEKNIYDTVSKAVACGKLVKSKHSQIAVGFLFVKGAETTKSDIEKQKKEDILIIQQMLLKLGQETSVSVQNMGLGQFVIYGTRGSIEIMTEQFNTFPLLKEVDMLGETKVSVGFGFGVTAKDAEGNARYALSYANKHEKNSAAYLVTDDKEIIGPLGINRKIYGMKSEDRTILLIAKKAGISVTNVNKFISFLKLNKQNRFTSEAIAQYFEISRRSAERMIKKLMDSKFVIIVGEEHPYKQGRPRAIYRATFH